MLLHACCAPCASSVCESLKGEFHTTIYFCNPNISPADEYTRRRDELARFCGIVNVGMIEADAITASWREMVSPYAHLGEKSPRCRECYRFRLGELFREAVRMKADAAATTLSVSPHKDFEMLCDIGREMEKKFGIPYLARDFKKNDGFRRSVELSREFGFYRQSYCGCEYSLRERLAARRS